MTNTLELAGDGRFLKSGKSLTVLRAQARCGSYKLNFGYRAWHTRFGQGEGYGDALRSRYQMFSHVYLHSDFPHRHDVPGDVKYKHALDT